jgi:hypothetical protein
MRYLRSSSAKLAGGLLLAGAAALIPAAALGDAPSAGPTASTVATTPAPDAAVGTPPAAAPSAASVARCVTSRLVVWLDTQGNGTAGSIYYTLEFTNLSGQACALGGYPGVSAVNLAGHQLGSAASRDTARKPRMITLAAGASATAVLRIVDAGNFPSSSCHQVTAAGLRVFAPNMTASKIVPFPFSACSQPGPAYLTVRALAPA